MFHKFIVWAREHPVWLGVGVFVVGIILLYFIFRRKAVPAVDNTGAYYAAQTAAQNAAAAENIAQQQSNTAAIGINAQLAAVNSQTEAQRQVGLAQTSASRDVNLAQIAATQEVTDTAHGDTLHALKLQTDYLTKASADQVAIATSTNSAAINLAGIHSNENITVAGITAGQAENVIATQTAGATEIARIQSAMTQGVTQITAQASKEIAQMNDQTAQYNTNAQTNAAVNIAQYQRDQAAHLDATNETIATIGALGKVYTDTANTQPGGIGALTPSFPQFMPQSTLEAITNYAQNARLLGA